MGEEKQWVRLCAVTEAPADDGLVQVEATGREICLANVAGVLRAIDNVCPHRQGPLAEGWIENSEIVCPWHGWSFNPETGACTNASGAVEAYPVKVQEEDVLIAI